jgi:dTDP-4-dehydrorhamnose reductase
MKLLVTGSGGQLGTRIVEAVHARAAHDVVALPRESLDIASREAVLDAVAAARPDWIINCAAYTDVERAEGERAEAFRLNDEAVGALADAAERHRARLLQPSTDYVFSGDFAGAPPRPYHEDDAPAPLSVYGESKLAGEARLRAHGARSLIVRTSWLYGGPGKNFLSTMLRLGREAEASGKPVRVVGDQRGSPTDAPSLARQIIRLVEAGAEGIVHASAHGEATWHEFAAEIFVRAGLHPGLERITSAEYPARARRPPYSVLENRNLGRLGLDILPDWREGLERALRGVAGRDLA